jgi:hypothetical protein
LLLWWYGQEVHQNFNAGAEDAEFAEEKQKPEKILRKSEAIVHQAI